MKRLYESHGVSNNIPNSKKPCTRRQTKMKNAEARREITPPTTTLHKLPAEFRDNIFKLTMLMETISMPARQRHRRPVQVTPPLLIALRCDPYLYEEALAVYYQINTFKISKNNFNSLRNDLSPAMLGLIRNLHIEIKWVAQMITWNLSLTKVAVLS